MVLISEALKDTKYLLMQWLPIYLTSDRLAVTF